MLSFAKTSSDSLVTVPFVPENVVASMWLRDLLSESRSTQSESRLGYAALAALRISVNSQGSHRWHPPCVES